MSRNYYRKLSASIYHHAKNVEIIGILAYPKMNKSLYEIISNDYFKSQDSYDINFQILFTFV